MRNENQTAAARLDLHIEKQYLLKTSPSDNKVTVLRWQKQGWWAFHWLCTSGLAQMGPGPGLLSTLSARLEPDSIREGEPSFVIRKSDSRKISKRRRKGDNLYTHPHISVFIYVSFYITLLCRSLVFSLFKVLTLEVR